MDGTLFRKLQLSRGVRKVNKWQSGKPSKTRRHRLTTNSQLRDYTSVLLNRHDIAQHRPIPEPQTLNSPVLQMTCR